MVINEVISIKYGWNTIVWTKIMYPGQVQDLLDIKIRTSCKTSNFCWYFRGTTTHKMSKVLGIWFAFLSEKTRLYRYYQNENHLVVISPSYINLIMKLLVKRIISPKTGRAKVKFFIGKQYHTFASERLFIFPGFIVLQGMIQVN